MDELKEYIFYLCKILRIKTVPMEVISKNKMNEISGEGTLAAYDKEKHLVYVLKKKEYAITDFYLLSHELRHAWQNLTDPDFYFNGYCYGMSEHEYNMTNAEIDANAFACVAIAIAFGKIVKRNYSSDEDAQRRYDTRLKELKKEFEIEF